MIEDEAVALVMVAAYLFKIFEDSAINLKDLLEADFFKKRASFFTADSTCTERHNRLVLPILRQRFRPVRELPEMLDV